MSTFGQFETTAGRLRPSRRASSMAMALRRLRSLSTRICSSCRCIERMKLAGSRRITMMRASGCARASSPAAVSDQMYAVEASPTRCSAVAGANSARESSNVFGGSPFGRSLKGDGRSLAKNRGSLRSGMKICGWLRSISYRAVVPLLGWPTMKKSGTLPWGAAICVSTAATPRPLTVCDRAAEPSSREDSGDAVIAPEGNEVPVQVLAQREHLTPESVTQLEHQIGVRLLGLGDHEAALNRFERGSADPLWHERLERRLCGSRGGTRAHRDRVHELVEALGAHGESRVGLDGLDRA